MSHLPDNAWGLRLNVPPKIINMMALEALLRSMQTPLPMRTVRLAMTLMLCPRMLDRYLPDPTEWRRLTLDSDDVGDTGWGEALSWMRCFKHLAEDLKAGTWGPGPGLDSLPALPDWAIGRAEVVLTVLSCLPENSVCCLSDKPC